MYKYITLREKPEISPNVYSQIGVAETTLFA